MMKDGRYFCDSCGKELDEEKDFIQCYDPYIEEIAGEKVIKDLCDDCYTDLIGDI